MGQTFSEIVDNMQPYDFKIDLAIPPENIGSTVNVEEINIEDLWNIAKYTNKC